MKTSLIAAAFTAALVAPFAATATTNDLAISIHEQLAAEDNGVNRFASKGEGTGLVVSEKALAIHKALAAENAGSERDLTLSLDNNLGSVVNDRAVAIFADISAEDDNR